MRPAFILGRALLWWRVVGAARHGASWAFIIEFNSASGLKHEAFAEIQKPHKYADIHLSFRDEIQPKACDIPYAVYQSV